MPELSIETRQLYHQMRQDVISIHCLLSVLLFLYRGTQHDPQVLKTAAIRFLYRLLPNELTDAIVLNLARLLDPATQPPYQNASLQMLINHIRDLDPTRHPLSLTRLRLASNEPAGPRCAIH